MGVHESILDERDYIWDYDDFYKLDCILNSDLSILRIWISLRGEDTIIKTRPDKIFYSDCCFHKAQDIPVCINENKKAFFCYGCGRGGTIVTLVTNYFRIGNISKAINILYAYVNNELSSLDKNELEILKKIFKNYNSPIVEKYLEESKEKTILLNDRINRYIENFGDSPDTIKKMTRRLCCSKNYIMKNK